MWMALRILMTLLGTVVSAAFHYSNLLRRICDQASHRVICVDCNYLERTPIGWRNRPCRISLLVWKQEKFLSLNNSSSFASYDIWSAKQ